MSEWFMFETAQQISMNWSSGEFALESGEFNFGLCNLYSASSSNGLI
jgi:hypothetical protein